VPDLSPAFDERAVLAELERLHRAIQLSRQERGRAVAEFDSLARAFREPDSRAEPSVTPPVHPAPSAPAPAVIEQQSTAGLEPASPGVTSGRSGLVYVAAAAIGGLLVAGFLIGRSALWTKPEPAAPVAVPSARQSETPPPTPAPAPTPPPVTPTKAVRVELTTLRPVWLRVMVDDLKTMERVIDGGERIPLEGDRSVVVRAGDGGAVRVMTEGRDAELMGQEGQPITRTFASPASPIAK
jgi:hypothetical protein